MGKQLVNFYHLRLRVEFTLFCNLQIWARTHAVIGDIGKFRFYRKSLKCKVALNEGYFSASFIFNFPIKVGFFGVFLFYVLAFFVQLRETFLYIFIVWFSCSVSIIIRSSGI